MIESLHFVAGRTCEVNSIKASSALTLQACLDSLSVTSEVFQSLSPRFYISPEAEAYAAKLRDFIWGALAPGLVSLFGLFSIPRLLRGLFGGL